MSKKWRHLTIFDDDGKADIKDIEAFEKKYNICFPTSYKELMLEHNGAYFEESSFDFINKRGQEDGRSFGFDYYGTINNSSDKNIDYYNQHLQDPLYYGVPRLIGIGSTAEGDTLCFDYREGPKTCEPKVVLLVHDEYEQDENDHMKIEHIANSFDAFLTMLYKYADDEE